MNMLRQLSQRTCTLGNTPTLYFGGRVVGVDLLRQYAATATKIKSQKKDSKSTVSTKEKRIKITKGSLIPDEPKKPSTPYGLFYTDFYHKKHKDHPEYKVTDIAKLAGEEWSRLSEKDKNLYAEQHKKILLEFQKSHKKWINSLTPEQIFEENRRRRSISKDKNGKKVRLIKDHRNPKKPRTPYINFVVDRMGPDEALRGPERIKELAFEWKNLSDKDKEPYTKAFEEDRLRYAKEKEAYKNLSKQTK